VERAGQLRVLWGDTRLTDEVRVMLTPGHTPAHQSVVIESEGETAVFLADTAHWPLHMERLEILTAYDVQPLVTLETKRRLARWAVEHRACTPRVARTGFAWSQLLCETDALKGEGAAVAPDLKQPASRPLFRRIVGQSYDITIAI
jgi:glyoxylase-like metal-dependent hydrolase (beta-lactamase superfamily II)